jgi:hypothetical protein
MIKESVMNEKSSSEDRLYALFIVAILVFALIRAIWH